MATGKTLCILILDLPEEGNTTETCTGNLYQISELQSVCVLYTLCDWVYCGRETSKCIIPLLVPTWYTILTHIT